MPEPSPNPGPDAPVATAEREPDPAPRRVSVDDWSEASFPASDPPAVWTWDPPRQAR